MPTRSLSGSVVGLDLLAQLQALLQRLPEFGVGVGAGGEIAVRLGLFRHHGDVLDANALQDAGDAHLAGAV